MHSYVQIFARLLIIVHAVTKQAKLRSTFIQEGACWGKWGSNEGLFLGQQVQAWLQACLSLLSTNMSDISPPAWVS